MAEIGGDINKAASMLQSGSLVAIPTETVYGLAGNALDPESIVKIYKVKDRPKFDPLIAHIGEKDDLNTLGIDIPEIIKDLTEKYWPGPLTVLVPKSEIVPDVLTSGLPNVAVRMPDHPITLNLLKSLDFPLAAPSANPFGYVSPTSAMHVQSQLGAKIPYILDGGQTTIGIESTIVSCRQNELIIHRLGGLRIEELERFAPIRIEVSNSNPLAPGQLDSHYSPRKPLIIGKIDQLVKRNMGKRIGVITFETSVLNVDKEIILSKNGNLDEAAANLFSALREMDAADLDIIITEKFPEFGLGRAINDRLNRAAVT